MKKSRFTDSQINACHEVGDGRLAPLLATAKSGGITHRRVAWTGSQHTAR